MMGDNTAMSTYIDIDGPCRFHCESEWLVIDGEPDAILVTREMAIDAGDRELEGRVYQKLLMPTEFTACPCNPLWSLNPEMEAQL